MTLLVPTLREDDDNFFGVKGPVLVTLALPAGTVSVKATAVRYERAGEGCPRAGCVLRKSSPTSTTIRAAAYPSTTNNQIDNDQFFARRHYLDFLNREPDASGLQFWTKEMTGCGADAQCREVKRINVSATFFLSIEFQQTGYLAYRAHKAAYGNIPGKPVPITREEILSDMSQVGDGVIVGQDDWEQRLEFNKRAYFDALVSTDRFTTFYPHSLSPEQYVDALTAVFMRMRPGSRSA